MPFVDGWTIEGVAEHLEAVSDGRIKRILINVPPGFMKSMMLNIFWPAYEWGPKGRPDLRYVAFSYSSTLTERDNEKFCYLVQSPEYQELYGDKVTIVKEGVGRISNTARGWKFASSVGGVGTGERGDRILSDDLHKVSEAESDIIRDSTVQWFRESMQNRLNDLADGVIVVLGQRVHEADVSGCILEHYPDYDHFMVPMEFESGRQYQTSIGWSDPREDDGDLAWPQRYPDEVLVPFKSIPFLWAGQYQQRPSPRGGGILKREWWGDWENIKTFPVFDFILASADTAYTEKTSNDPSALTIWGLYVDQAKRTRVMLIDGWMERLELHDLVTAIAKSCKKFKVDRLLIEAKATGISVAQEITRLYYDKPYLIDLINPRNMDKVARAHSIVPVFVDGVVVAPIDPDDWIRPAWAELVITQCESFPTGKHDDLVDASTQALHWLRDNGLIELGWEAQNRRTEALKYRSPKASKPLYLA